jgi:hypothetical protein
MKTKSIYNYFIETQIEGLRQLKKILKNDKSAILNLSSSQLTTGYGINNTIEWIPVNKRLPKEESYDRDYLVFNCDVRPERGISTATFHKGEWYDYTSKKHFHRNYITHWAELPKPPEEFI